MEAAHFAGGEDGAPPAVLVNDRAFHYLYKMLGAKTPLSSHKGITLNASNFEILRERYQKNSPHLPPDELKTQQHLIATLGQALRHNKGRGIGIVRVEAGTTPEAIIQLRRHEFVHVMQEKWRVGIEVLKSLTARVEKGPYASQFSAVRQELEKRGYDKDKLWVELPAFITGGHFKNIGLSPEAAQGLLTEYAHTLYAIHGGQAVQEMMAHGSKPARAVAAKFQPDPRNDRLPSPHRNGNNVYDPNFFRDPVDPKNTFTNPTEFRSAVVSAPRPKNSAADALTGTAQAVRSPTPFQAAKPSALVGRLNRLPLPDALDMYARSGPLQKQLLGDTLQRKLGSASRTNTLRAQDRQRAKGLGLF